VTFLAAKENHRLGLPSPATEISIVARFFDSASVLKTRYKA